MIFDPDHKRAEQDARPLTLPLVSKRRSIAVARAIFSISLRISFRSLVPMPGLSAQRLLT
jgi:hypothetical protein